MSRGKWAGELLVHAGHNIWLDKTVWEKLMSSSKDSLFVKDSAVAIWSTVQLARRSVTGKLSNRHTAEGKTAQGPLTPQTLKAIHCIFDYYARMNGAGNEDIKKRSKSIRRYLIEKMCQLRR
ncbi:BEN domain-containing protein 5-like [Ornithodoros turicata]|uniref:BEN domain-containing protein 5-like n=1 Tax=Ornithodoros turicata TaxID=34597 RepID=UPI0031398607